MAHRSDETDIVFNLYSDEPDNFCMEALKTSDNWTQYADDYQK